MKKTARKLIIIIIIFSSVSCLEKGTKSYLHKFAGIWEIESLQRYYRTDNGYEIEHSFENVGFIELYDNCSDIGKYNNCITKVDTSVHSAIIQHLTGSYYNQYNNGYWYADNDMRLTLWYEVIFNGLSWQNYSTFTVHKKQKDKQEWTFYYNLNDSTGQISPYLDPTHKETISVKRKTH